MSDAAAGVEIFIIFAPLKIYSIMAELSEQEIIRRKKLDDLLQLGINPYPAAEYEVNATTKEILEKFPQDNSLFQEVSIAGRIMSQRIMGAVSFYVLQDAVGKIQIYAKRDEICPGEDKTMYNSVFKKLDIGDIIGVKGFVFTTQTGETSIHVKEFTILCKSVCPLPIVKEKDGVVYDAFQDPEQRYRQRYIDLIVNPQIKDTFIKRTLLVNTMRNYLNEKGYLEVETPILQPLYGGAAARPFKTHHNTLDMTLYLRIADELYLKKNEGMDRFHNPEFTQMELYVPYKDYEWMMNTVEEMVERIALALHGTTQVQVGDNVIDFKRPWKRYTMFEAIEHFTGTDISEMDEAQLAKFAASQGVKVDETMGKGKLIDEIFGETCESKLIQPTFIYDYPIEMSPLTKKHRSKPGLTERFEAMCNGKEICNAYSELNDPIDQRKRFEDQLELGKRGDTESMVLDEDFLRSLEIGMPPTAGLGIGIDRLAMIMTNSPSIQDVLFFPQMRPEKKPEMSKDEEFIALGMDAAWIPALKKLNILTVDQLKQANPNKLLNDLGGLRKKLKLEVPAATLEEIKKWIGAEA